ncbi:hypothetical protein KFE25_003511 [Diacronema lutheri]|uniref:Uncharacterized protein n=1 Tax=Diacronema lutheri TaxID=2081491 RepID=A0A8J5XD16_DIALT|nr:hypothetical protein KFE25_003511 [Diacronema lutheri]
MLASGSHVEHGTLAARAGRLICPYAVHGDCASSPIDDAELARHTPASTFALHLRARERLREHDSLQASLVALFPDARQCGRCSLGPITHAACADLLVHDGRAAVMPSSVQRGDSFINNSCPRCGWFSHSIEHWPSWDGVLRDGELHAQWSTASSAAWRPHRASAIVALSTWLWRLCAAGAALASMALLSLALAQAIRRHLLADARLDEHSASVVAFLAACVVASFPLAFPWSPCAARFGVDQGRCMFCATHISTLCFVWAAFVLTGVLILSEVPIWATLAIVMLMLGVPLLHVQVRANRLWRLEWEATNSAQAEAESEEFPFQRLGPARAATDDVELGASPSHGGGDVPRSPLVLVARAATAGDAERRHVLDKAPSSPMT